MKEYLLPMPLPTFKEVPPYLLLYLLWSPYFLATSLDHSLLATSPQMTQYSPTIDCHIIIMCWCSLIIGNHLEERIRELSAPDVKRHLCKRRSTFCSEAPLSAPTSPPDKAYLLFYLLFVKWIKRDLWSSCNSAALLK